MSITFFDEESTINLLNVNSDMKVYGDLDVRRNMIIRGNITITGEQIDVAESNITDLQSRVMELEEFRQLPVVTSNITISDGSNAMILTPSGIIGTNELYIDILTSGSTPLHVDSSRTRIGIMTTQPDANVTLDVNGFIKSRSIVFSVRRTGLFSVSSNTSILSNINANVNISPNSYGWISSAGTYTPPIPGYYRFEMYGVSTTSNVGFIPVLRNSTNSAIQTVLQNPCRSSFVSCIVLLPSVVHSFTVYSETTIQQWSEFMLHGHFLSG